MGKRAAQVRWIEADVTKGLLNIGTFDLWHDPAVTIWLARLLTD